MELAKDADDALRLTKLVCKEFVERKVALEMPTRVADFASVEYLLGAATMAYVLEDNKLALGIGRFVSEVVNKHGYMSIATAAGTEGDGFAAMADSVAQKKARILAAKPSERMAAIKREFPGVDLDGATSVRVVRFDITHIKGYAIAFLSGAVFSAFVLQLLH